MKAPERVTISMDEETARLFRKLRDELGVSQSEMMREALKFYSRHRSIFESVEDRKLYTHAEMLSAGEHVILDIDHWLLFLRFIDTHPDAEAFWEKHRDVCRAHAEQFRHRLYSADLILNRLEACNLFKLSRTSDTEYTLILSSDLSKKFVRTEVEEILRGMGFAVEIKEDFGKIRVKLLH